MEFGDAKLVYRLNHKDDKVWEELFNSYYESLCNHAYRILLDESVTEDIVQEVFVKLWDGRAVFENEKAGCGRSPIEIVERGGTGNDRRGLFQCGAGRGATEIAGINRAVAGRT